MQISAEIRWFWPTAIPRELECWLFEAPVRNPKKEVPPEKRSDIYLAAIDQNELGLKRRGANKGLELKGLVAVIKNALRKSPLVGPAEVWAKWVAPEELSNVVS
jgi:hypothetical protein